LQWVRGRNEQKKELPKKHLLFSVQFLFVKKAFRFEKIPKGFEAEIWI
jgi:hypothetical protein